MYKPEDILKIVKFNAKDNKWKYNPKKKDLFSYQAEGVAGILNRLKTKGIALLADEVGMGKTIQALSVIVQQFIEKKSSNVLVIVPRKEMLIQWKDQEYKEFINKHLNKNYKDMLPTSDKLIELDNLHNSFSHSDKYGNIIFCKTTSFSRIEENELQKLKNDIKIFDLIIVDESHKYRNYDEANNPKKEDSLRIKNAKEIFGAIREDSKILLMTATPLHSKEGDVKRVVSLFKKNVGKTDKEIMKNIMIRRLRVMSNGANKYQYRKEIDIPVRLSSNNSFKNEIFFAMLQKSFVKNLKNPLDLSKSKHLLDYLEGTNFDNVQENEPDIKKIVMNIVDKYKKTYKELPSNQKYETVLQNINNNKEKALIFVRRKASAYELTKQAISEFDKKAWRIINSALNKTDIKMPKNKDDFNKTIKRYTKSLSKGKLDAFIKKRKVNDFFEEYKKMQGVQFKGKHKKTILLDMAENYFLMFDEYSEENFNKFVEEINNCNTVDKENFSKSDEKMPKSKLLDFFKRKSSTDASRFVLRFNVNEDYKSIFSEFLPTLLNYDKNKSELIKSAVLYSSIGVVELYALYLKTNRNFKRFKKAIENGINKDTLKFIQEIKEFNEHFDKFEKYISENDYAVDKNSPEDDKDIEKTIISSNMFYNSQPAYPYISDTKNKYIIAKFNSPFFPYILCGTSVLQEGVNLHLFCNKIYHFGAAHTMGDDEQRTGRVDRIMGKMDRELSDDNKLEIYYPYLENTFDERNLQKMLTHKRETEYKIDNCRLASKTQYTEYKRNFFKPIKELLLQSKKEVETEPYGWEYELTEK